MLDSRVQCESAVCPGTCCWWNMNHVTSGPCSQQPHNLTLHIIAASTWSMMKQAEIELNLYSLEFDWYHCIILRERLCLLYFSSLMVSDPSAFTSQVLLQDDVGLNFPAAAFVLSAELQQLRRFLQHTALQPQYKIFLLLSLIAVCALVTVEQLTACVHWTRIVTRTDHTETHKPDLHCSLLVENSALTYLWRRIRDLHFTFSLLSGSLTNARSTLSTSLWKKV